MGLLVSCPAQQSLFDKSNLAVEKATHHRGRTEWTGLSLVTLQPANYSSFLRVIPQSNITISRHIYNMSKDIEKQFDDKVHDSRFSLQIDEAIDKNIRIMDDTREDLLAWQNQSRNV